MFKKKIYKHFYKNNSSSKQEKEMINDHNNGIPLPDDSLGFSYIVFKPKLYFGDFRATFVEWIDFEYPFTW